MTTPVAAAWPSSPLPGRLARLLLTLPFWWSGVAKLLDFPSARWPKSTISACILRCCTRCW